MAHQDNIVFNRKEEMDFLIKKCDATARTFEAFISNINLLKNALQDPEDTPELIAFKYKHIDNLRKSNNNFLRMIGVKPDEYSFRHIKSLFDNAKFLNPEWFNKKMDSR
jgi:hypothetical protein